MQSNKKNLILIPALMCNQDLYKNQISALKESYNIYVISNININNMQDLINYTINEIQNYIGDNKFALAGTSMGGYVAMELMNSSIKQNIEKLCLINTTAYPDSEEKKLNRLHNIAIVEQQSNDEFINNAEQSLNKLLPMYLYNKQEEKYNLIKNMYTNMGKQAFINQNKCILSRNNYTNQINNYNINTLIISSKNDNITPTEVHLKMHKAINNSNIVILEKCAHLGPIDQDIAITALLSYWLQQ